MLQPYPYPPRQHRPIAQAPYARPPPINDSQSFARSSLPPPPSAQPPTYPPPASRPRPGPQYVCGFCRTPRAHFFDDCPKRSGRRVGQHHEREHRTSPDGAGRAMADGAATIATLTWVMSALVADGSEHERPSNGLNNHPHHAGGGSEGTEPARPVERASSKNERRQDQYDPYAPNATEPDRGTAGQGGPPFPQNHDRPGPSSSSSRPVIVYERPAHGGLPPQGPSHPAGTSERDRGQPREVESSRPSSQRRTMDHWERDERQGQKRNHWEAGFDQGPSEERSRRMRSDEMPRDGQGRRPAKLQNKVKGHRTGPASQRGRWPNGGMNCSRTPPPSHDILSRIEDGGELLRGDAPPDQPMRALAGRRDVGSDTAASRGPRSTGQSLQNGRKGWPAPATASYPPGRTEPPPQRHHSDKGVEIVYVSGKRTFFAYNDDDGPRTRSRPDRSPSIVHQDDSAADLTHPSWPANDGVGVEMDDVDRGERGSLSRSASPSADESGTNRPERQAGDGPDGDLDWDQLTICQDDPSSDHSFTDALSASEHHGQTANGDGESDGDGTDALARPRTPAGSDSDIDRSCSPADIELDRRSLVPVAITSDVPFSPTVMSILPNDIPTRRLMLYHNLSSARKERPRPLESCASSDALASGASTPRVKREASSDGGVGSGLRLTKPDAKGQMLLLRVGPDGAQIVERFNNLGSAVVASTSIATAAPSSVVAQPARLPTLQPVPSPLSGSFNPLFHPHPHPHPHAHEPPSSAQLAGPAFATMSSPTPLGAIHGWRTDGCRPIRALPSQASAFVARSWNVSDALVPSAVRPDASDDALSSCVPDDGPISPSPQPSRSTKTPEQVTTLRARAKASSDRLRSIRSTSTAATGPAKSRAVPTLGLTLAPPPRLSESNMLGLSIDRPTSRPSCSDKDESASPATEAPVVTPSDAEPPVLPAKVQATILGLLSRDEQQTFETMCAKWNRGVVAATAEGASASSANDTALGLDLGADQGLVTVPEPTAESGQSDRHLVVDASGDAASEAVLGATPDGPQRTIETVPSSEAALENEGMQELVGLWAENMPSVEEVKR